MHVRIVIGVNLLIFIQIKLHIRDCDIFETNTIFYTEALVEALSLNRK